MADPLDDLPIDVLLALQEAVSNPTEEGLERARLRAEDAGFWLQRGGRDVQGATSPAPSEAPVLEPEPMEPAPAGTRGVVLDLTAGLSPVLSARRGSREET